MKRTVFAFIIIVLISITGCSHKLIGTKIYDNSGVNEIISENIESVFSVPKYKPETNTSEYFLQFNFPGIYFDFAELSFASLSDFIADIDELNKAYRFSKITNKVFVCDSVNCDDVFILEDVLDNTYKDIMLLTSPTYNEGFYPSFPAPVPDSLLMWAVMENTVYKPYKIIPNRDTIDVCAISYEIEFSVARINIERPITLKVKDRYKGKKLAVIKEIILVKELCLAVYPENVSVIYNPNNKKIKIKSHQPVMRVKQQHPVMAGFICKIIQ